MARRFSRLDEGTVVYETPFLILRECRVERNGAAGTYSIVERPDSITVIPLTPTGRTVLLKQFRFPTKETSWELPMGAIHGAETPEGAARRELMEEVGLRAAEVVQVRDYRPAPGLTSQNTAVFVAPVADQELDRARATWSASEEIVDVCAVHFGDVAEMVTDGRVTDGFSLAAYLLVRLWLDQQETRSQ